MTYLLKYDILSGDWSVMLYIFNVRSWEQSKWWLPETGEKGNSELLFNWFKVLVT